MTKTRSTKRALLMSGLALLMCVSMLIGSTFAWFTDSVTSGINKIVAGNLDVELYHSDKAATDEQVGDTTKLFDDVTLWEPGAMVWEKLTVKNLGSLALKYSLTVNVSDISVVDGKSLADVLKVAVMDVQPTRENIVTAEKKDLASFVLKSDCELEAKTGVDDFYVAIYWAPSANDNDYNIAGEKLYANLGVTLVATQATVESDSFDDQYDKDAEYPKFTDTWDGTADTSWFDAGKTEFTISNGAQLAGMAKLGNQLGGKTITLDSDIDLGGKNWTPINIFAPEQSFTFDGGNHTIYNLNVTGRSDGGLFDNSVGTIKNLKLSDAQIETVGRSAILAGRHYGDIINCHVKDSTIEDSYWAVGGIVGLLNSGNIKNCSVTNINVKSNGGVGGIVGVLNETSGTRTIENCSVIGGTIENTGLYGSSYSGGGIVGMINISNSTVNITGCNSTATLKGEYIFEIHPPVDDDITLNIN